jgi:large subunit ribosomal protein L13
MKGIIRMKFTQMVNQADVQKDWVVIDAKGKTFGRIITEVASILRGKHKPTFTPNVDCGDYVVVINASEAKFTGAKLETKNYYTHSGYFGSTKTHKMSDMLTNNPEKLYKLATRGMLPKTKLGAKILKNLKVYAGAEHPHTAQVKGA